MKLQTGQVVSFNGHAYEVRSQLGSGAVSDVYLAALVGDGAPAEVAIKLVHDQAGPDSRQAQAARVEAEVLAALNRAEDPRWRGLDSIAARLSYAQQTLDKRRIVALLDSGTEPDGRVFQIQELAPPAFRRLPIERLPEEDWSTRLGYERSLIGVAEAVARAIEVAHSQGFALKDFEPRGEKVDRIRVDWDAPANVKIIDWNITAGPNATATEKNSDLLYLGGHLYYFLLGENIELTGRVPADLGLGVAGWAALSEGSRQIVRRLLGRRYPSAREVREDLAWWLETLAQRGAGELERRVRQAGERASRKLAVADLALRLEIGPAERERFEQVMAQARRELERADRIQLDQGIVNLRTGLYRKAVEEFDRNLRDPQLAPELARQARLYRLQAQFAIWLREQTKSGNLGNNPVWQLVSRAVEDLQRQQWPAAIDALSDAAGRLPPIDAENPLQLLRGLASAGLLVSQAGQLQSQARGVPQSVAALDQWIKDERKRQDELAPIVEDLRKAAHDLAPQEPFYETFYRAAQDNLDRRGEQLAQYERVGGALHEAATQRREADKLLAYVPGASGASLDRDPVAAYGLVLEALQEALDAARQAAPGTPDSSRQAQLVPDIEARIEETRAIRASLRQLPEIMQMIRHAQFDRARALAEQAYGYLTGYPPARALLAVAQSGVERQSKAELLFGQAREAIRLRTSSEARSALNQARGLLDQLLGMHLQPLAQEGDRAMLAGDGESMRFQLPEGEDARRLKDLIDLIGDVRAQVLDRRDIDHSDAVAQLERLSRELAPFGYGLSDDEAARLKEARSSKERIAEAATGLKSARARPADDTLARAGDLRDAMAHLRDDPTPEAARLREDAAREWLRLCGEAREFDLVYDLLGEGSRLFAGTLPAEQLRTLRKRAAPGAAISRRFPASAPENPGWLAGAERAGILAKVEANLGQLKGAIDQLPLLALRQSLPSWTERITEAIAALLSETYDQACALSDDNSFEEALEHVRAVWQSVPEALRDLAPDERDQVQLLIDALARRMQLAEDLGRIAQQLADGRLGPGEAATLVPKLPAAHPRVSLADLQAFEEGLKRLAALLAEARPDEIDAQWLYRRYTRHEEIARIHQQMLAFEPAKALADQLALLGRSAAREAIAATDQMGERLVQIAPLDQADRSLLARLFWTLAWWQAMTAARDPEASARAAQALEQARAKLRAATAPLRDQLLRATSAADVELARQSLRRVCDCNQLLAHWPPEVALPDNVTPVEQRPVFAADKLTEWQTIAEEIARAARMPVPDQEPEEYSAESLGQAIDALQTLRDGLAHLRSNAWPALFPDEYAAGERAPALDCEAAVLIERAKALRQAHELHDKIEPIETLYALDQSLSRLNDAVRTGLLDNMRATTLYHHRAIGLLLRSALGRYVRQILDTEDSQRAAQQLRAELLEKPTSDVFAVLVENAILDSITLHDGTPESQRRGVLPDRLLRWWQSVRDATMPWQRGQAAALKDQQQNTDGHV